MEILGIILVLILGCLMSKLSHKAYLRAMFFLGCLMLISELWKQWTLTNVVYGGFYVVWYFPFQLCSIPMYLCPLMLWLPDSLQKRIQIFLMTFSLLGGVAVFLDTTGMHYPLISLTIHSYIWHYLLILMGSWSGFLWRREEMVGTLNMKNSTMEDSPMEDPSMGEVGSKADNSVDNLYGEKSRRWTKRIGAFARMLPLWFGCLGIATILNLVLWPKGEISMFYISPFEESTQIIVHDVAVRYGIHAANLGYLAAMLAGAWIVYSLWCLEGKRTQENYNCS